MLSGSHLDHADAYSGNVRVRSAHMSVRIFWKLSGTVGLEDELEDELEDAVFLDFL